jgi:PAS domain-containing protein
VIYLNEEKDSRERLRELVEQQQSKERPQGDWVTSLQDLMNDGSLFSEAAKQMPFPLILYNNDGVVEMANAIFLKETGLTDDDIKSGKADVMSTGYEKLAEAAMMAFRGTTTVVKGLEHPLNSFCLSGSAADPNSYKCAIVFPQWDTPILYGTALFLPMEL